MSFTTPCFIRKNSKELQNKLVDIGYKFTCFPSGDALVTENERSLAYIEKLSNVPYYGIEEDCGTNEELFLAIAALRDDYDCNQYFWYKDKLFKCIGGGSTVLMSGDYSIKLGSKLGYFDVMKSKIRKATVEELIKHFAQ